MPYYSDFYGVSSITNQASGLHIQQNLISVRSVYSTFTFCLNVLGYLFDKNKKPSGKNNSYIFLMKKLIYV